MRATTRVLENGRITLPCVLRESLELEHGDVVEVEIKRVEESKNSIVDRNRGGGIN
jgi:AbrB family looped-hinge helix DNA binding protein